ncbi:MAG TPA: type II toxin-antitoxin system RelE/ParE family toxin [Chthoniobacteraceae bacterium]|jgi:toxin ParE1/3/4|nr:type II toxin-antitoxin system RelE/ParE family toxin [Chthoniobacteraceae bacterium]
MSIRKSDFFIADAELQYQWYAKRAGWEVAERYLSAIASTCALIGRQSLIGPVARLNHPRLAGWRFFVAMRPFHRHVLFYEILEGEVIMRRVLHGRRNLPKRLLEPPGSE